MRFQIIVLYIVLASISGAASTFRKHSWKFSQRFVIPGQVLRIRTEHNWPHENSQPYCKVKAIPHWSSVKTKRKAQANNNRSRFVALERFELSQAEPESDVLPLHHKAMYGGIIPFLRCKVTMFFWTVQIFSEQFIRKTPHERLYNWFSGRYGTINEDKTALLNSSDKLSRLSRFYFNRNPVNRKGPSQIM